MKNRLFVSIVYMVCLFALAATAPAQISGGNGPAAMPILRPQPTMLIDAPTAGTLRRGTFNAVVRTYPNGGILGSTNIGLSNRLMVGISYGAEGIIAETQPNYNPRVEFDIRANLVDESLAFPAISLGFCSQGYGSAHKAPDPERYDFKSKGFYAVGSKNYLIYDWNFGFHGGINYSTEKDDNDDNVNFFIGVNTIVNKDVGFAVEYDFALNDNLAGTSFGAGKGYLNIALQWLYSDNLVMEVLLKNLNNNRKTSNDIWRALRVTYTEHF